MTAKDHIKASVVGLITKIKAIFMDKQKVKSSLFYLCSFLSLNVEVFFGNTINIILVSLLFTDFLYDALVINLMLWLEF